MQITPVAARSASTPLASTPQSLVSGSSRFSGVRCSVVGSGPPRRDSRRALQVSCNELNKWADRSNYDEHNDDEWEKSQFDRETAAVVLKVLTAKATQRLLFQLQELDIFKAQWLSNYCSENPPSGSNKFLLEMLRQPSTTVVDATNATSHTIDPANLAHRIVQIRSEMASGMTKFPKFVEVETTEVLRQHLMRSTYVSGTSTGGSGERGDYKERRGYHRPRN